MDTHFPVTIPLLNPNEPEAFIAALHIQPGQYITTGDSLCTLETTKSAAEVQAEHSGYVAGLSFQTGDTVQAGQILCFLAATPDWAPPSAGAADQPANQAEQAVPEGLRITQPALALARHNQIDFNLLPKDRLITETVIRAFLPAQMPTPTEYLPPTTPADSTALIIYGGGGHAKALIDVIRAVGGYRIVGVLDDSLAVRGELLGVPVLGGAEQLPQLFEQGIRLAVNAVGGIGNVKIRIHVFERLAQAGFAFPALVHPRAVVEQSASLNAGVQVFPLAYVGSEVKAGFGTIINTGAIVSHECSLGDFVNISPGAILAGQVQLGSGALVGMGATINLQVKVGAGARIGNGATVKSDVPAGGVVRAGAAWPA